MNALEKLSSYNLVTSLIPGWLLLEALRAFGLPFVDSSQLATWLALAYVLGLVSSRIGSLVISPLLKYFLPPKNNTYAEFVLAGQQDTKIDILLETANSYRTLAGAGCVFLVLAFLWWVWGRKIEQGTPLVVSVIGLTILFLVSYRKQINYVSKRVQANGKT